MPYYPDTSYILPLVHITRERRLPVLGRVNVSAGQNVRASEIIASAEIPERHVIINLLDELKVTAEQFEEEIGLLNVQALQAIKEGDVIAQSKGFLSKRVVKAPVNGRIKRIVGGRLIVEAESKEINLRAGVDGRVIDVEPSRGATIEAIGALIQCVWGTGKLANGVLKVVGENKRGVLPLEAISMRDRGALVASRQPIDAEFLTRAVQDEFGLVGIIVPSMRAALQSLAQELGLTVVLTEGFGDRNMNDAAYGLLKDNETRSATIDAAPSGRWSSARPEVIIPMKVARANAPPPIEALATGDQVRILREPLNGESLIGAVGRVRALPAAPRIVDSGVRTRVAEIELVGGRGVFVPLANLEKLGLAPDN